MQQSFEMTSESPV